MTIKIPENVAKERLRQGKVAFGFGVRFSRSPEIARIASGIGYHWLFIDLEHNTMNHSCPKQHFLDSRLRNWRPEPEKGGNSVQDRRVSAGKSQLRVCSGFGRPIRHEAFPGRLAKAEGGEGRATSAVTGRREMPRVRAVAPTSKAVGLCKSCWCCWNSFFCPDRYEAITL
jgi:hypothetical protein